MNTDPGPSSGVIRYFHHVATVAQKGQTDLEINFCLIIIAQFLNLWTDRQLPLCNLHSQH